MQLPAALSPLTRDLVTGPGRTGKVMAVFPTALYLAVSGGDRDPLVLPVVTADALLLPTALRLGLHSTAVSWPVAPGDEVVVGGGAVIGPHLEVRGVRAWRPSRVASGLTAPEAPALRLLPDGGALGGLCSELAAAALAGQPVQAHVAGLVGAGMGLTPSGDDALCGVLLALRAWAPSARPAAAVAEVVARCRHRTTDPSASLLTVAADGYAVPQVVSLVRALADGDRGAASVVPALEAVLAIGHSSGPDLVSGLVGALQALSPSSVHVSPSTVHVSSSTVHLSPSSVHVSPSSVHVSPSSVHVSPSTVQSPPEGITRG